jgi:hypothetical protein
MALQISGRRASMPEEIDYTCCWLKSTANFFLEKI